VPTGPKKLPTLRDSTNPEQLDMFQRDVREQFRRVADELDAAVSDLGTAISEVETTVASGVSSVTGSGIITAAPTTGAVVVSIDTSGLAGAAHTHVKADVTDFAHTHPISDVTSLQTTLDALAADIATLPDGSGTTNYLAKWTDADTLGIGSVTDTGSLVAIAAGLSVSGTTAAANSKITLSYDGVNSGYIRVNGAAGSNMYFQTSTAGGGNATAMTLDFNQGATVYGNIVSSVGNITSTFGTVTGVNLVATNNATLGNASSDAHTLTGTLNLNGAAGSNTQVAQIVGGLPTWGAIPAHTHVEADITDFAHTHPQSDITNLVSDLSTITTNISNLTTTVSALPDGSGTANVLAMWTDANTLGDSPVSDGVTYLNVQRDTTFFGQSGGGYAYFSGSQLNFMHGSNAADTGYINHAGYAGGTTQFRNLQIGDGKNGQVAYFDGASKSLGVNGNININGQGSPTYALNLTKNTATVGAIFAGTSEASYFLYDTNEHIYLRGGKAASIVHIGDSTNTGGIILGHATNPTQVRGNLEALGNTTLGNATSDVHVITGDSRFVGDANISYFNITGTQDTYIRGGKNTSAVIIGDLNTGTVYLGAVGNPTRVYGTLTVDGNTTLGDSVTGDAHITNGNVTHNLQANADAMQVLVSAQTQTNATTYKTVNIDTDVSFASSGGGGTRYGLYVNTDAARPTTSEINGAVTAYGGYFRADTTGVVGAPTSPLSYHRAIGLYATAAGAATANSETYAAWFDGTVYVNGGLEAGSLTVAGVGSVLTTSNVSGTSGTIAKFTGTNTVGNSIITESGTALTVAGSLAVNTGLAVGNDISLGGNELHFRRGANATDTGYINYYGYLDGLTQFRDLVIADGKGATVATFTGSTKSLNVVGTLSQNGTAVSLTGHTHTKANITDFAHTHAQSDITNLTSDLALKAPLASPTFTGTVTSGGGLSVGGSVAAANTKMTFDVNGVNGTIRFNGAAGSNLIFRTSTAGGVDQSVLTLGFDATATFNGNVTAATVYHRQRNARRRFRRRSHRQRLAEHCRRSAEGWRHEYPHMASDADVYRKRYVHPDVGHQSCLPAHGGQRWRWWWRGWCS
jgi:hypothetical protein